MDISIFLQIAGLFLFPLLAVLIPLFIGQRYGIYCQKKSADPASAPVGSVVAAAFGLLAFMLAFTFQIAADRYNKRKELLLDEVTKIRTAYLRAGLIPEPFSFRTEKLLTEYVNLRVELPKDLSRLDQALFRSQQILDSCWSYTVALAKQDRSSEIYALYTSSINDLVDDHNQRVTITLEYRIPAVVLWVLFIIIFLSMLVLGYQFGISGERSFELDLLLAIIFSVVMFLILVLDRPEMGLTNVSQQPILKLQQQLNEANKDGAAMPGN